MKIKVKDIVRLLDRQIEYLKDDKNKTGESVAEEYKNGYYAGIECCKIIIEANFKKKKRLTTKFRGDFDEIMKNVVLRNLKKMDDIFSKIIIDEYGYIINLKYSFNPDDIVDLCGKNWEYNLNQQIYFLEEVWRFSVDNSEYDEFVKDTEKTLAFRGMYLKVRKEIEGIIESVENLFNQIELDVDYKFKNFEIRKDSGYVKVDENVYLDVFWVLRNIDLFRISGSGIEISQERYEEIKALDVEFKKSELGKFVWGKKNV